jgi:hypothetical protein
VANNRMYLKNTRTGERAYIAKYYPSLGWYPPEDLAAQLMDFFERQDFGHLSEEDLMTVHRLGFQSGPKLKSAGGMYGAEYVLEMEKEGEPINASPS